ncbi:asparagine synthase (glutamine-hydrolyzing) [Brevundimonas vesicularis]|uniref:asparagine synthase-related protein n=1 Tax=Brevundimonas vesicularis TaxID=41276 RepID=UPI00278724C0|nr:asparagine synthase-related protein [Brevundimonas vesicularis]MDQ1193790.1 asparagine synthase (glutamine-hydrolyzing) [Brevundimonas vesicularis]
MAAVLALSWTDAPSAAAAATVQRAAQTAGFQTVSSLSQGWLGVAGRRPPAVHDLRGGLIAMGDLFDHPDDGRLGVGGRLDRLRNLTRTKWGRYIALDRDADGALRAAMRDPSGSHELAVWRSSGVTVVTTGTPDWLIAAAPISGAIRWDAVPALLADPDASLTQPPLEGLIALDAGEMIDLDTDTREQIWRPWTGRQPDLWSAPAAAAGLRDRIDACVGSLAATVSRCGAELSGGLDSAIVAAALGAHRPAMRLWLNAFSSRPETDERHYAARVSERLGLTLTAAQRCEQALEPEVLDRTAGGVRPGLNGADPVFDALIAQACAAAGLDGLLTGKGGDALFYQGASPAILGDLLKARGAFALVSPVWPGLSRWIRRSAWSVLAEAKRPTASTLPAGPTHPWIVGAETLPDGKRAQLAALVSNLAYVTACRRTEVVDLIHPLMAQPLIEWTMRIPTPVLTAGKTDRHLARSAFADRLPAEVAWRRSKGDYTATFEREAAASLPFLRDHLLGGLLAERGVIDRVQVEALLDRDRLMWAGGSASLTTMALVESWLRRWTARLGSQ